MPKMMGTRIIYKAIPVYTAAIENPSVGYKSSAIFPKSSEYILRILGIQIALDYREKQTHKNGLQQSFSYVMCGYNN